MGIHDRDYYRGDEPGGLNLSGSATSVAVQLIAVNVAVFVLSVSLGDGLMGSIGADGLLFDGAANGFFIDQQGEWWRVITAGFLHYGLFHLGFNMYALWIIGPIVEALYGPWRFLAIYLVCVLAGSAASYATSVNPAVGASGGASGVTTTEPLRRKVILGTSSEPVLKGSAPRSIRSQRAPMACSPSRMVTASTSGMRSRMGWWFGLD